MEQIINSLLETDMYKFSMGQAIYHQFSDYKTTWSFKCRNKDVHFTPEIVEKLLFTKWCNDKYVDYYVIIAPNGTISTTGTYEIDME